MANFNKIKRLAREKGVTLHDVAMAIGITPTAISKIMKENSTSAKTLQALCNFFGVSADYFFTDDDHNSADDILYNSGTPQDIIKAKLNYLNMSVGELARLMNTSQQRIWYSLHNASSIKASDLRTMCKILDLDYRRMTSTNVKIDNTSPYREPSAPVPTMPVSIDNDIEWLKEQIKQKDEQIKMLMDVNTTLMEAINRKYGNGFSMSTKRCEGDPF
jgi:transcriptional regulator with XRE-family HTH domain